MSSKAEDKMGIPKKIEIFSPFFLQKKNLVLETALFASQIFDD
jgi:hypothetical protein